MANNQASKALEQKHKKLDRIRKMEEEIDELNKKAEQELGRYILKKWNVGDDMDKVFETIDSLTEQANNLLKDNNDMGKSEETEKTEEHQTH